MKISLAMWQILDEKAFTSKKKWWRQFLNEYGSVKLFVAVAGEDVFWRYVSKLGGGK